MTDILDPMTAVMVALALVLLAAFMSFIRLILGPTMPDRVIALDKMTVSIVAFCGLAALWSGDVAFLDVAMVLALVGFIATVSLARFAERAVARRKLAEESDHD